MLYFPISILEYFLFNSCFPTKDSNELFFTGRNIFPSKEGETTITENYNNQKEQQVQGTTLSSPSPATNQLTCDIVYKPFKLEDFDACLSVSEDTENYVNILAGNHHFTVLTCKY